MPIRILTVLISATIVTQAPAENWPAWRGRDGNQRRNRFFTVHGKTLWQVDGPGNEVYAMPILGDDGRIIVGVSGHNGRTIAIRPGGTGIRNAAISCLSSLGATNIAAALRENALKVDNMLTKLAIS